MLDHRYTFDLEYNNRDDRAVWVARFDGHHIGWGWTRGEATEMAESHARAFPDPFEVLLPRGMSNHGGEQRIYPATRLEMDALLVRLDETGSYYIVLRNGGAER